MGDNSIRKANEPAVSSSHDGSKTSVRALMSTLLPSILGLAFARAGLIAACYGSYENTDEGLFTDGAMLVSLMILLIPFLMIVASKKPIGKTWTNRIARFCIVAEVATICAIGATNLLDPLNVPVRFALSVVCTTCASGAIFYWLRRMRGSIASVSALFVFGALIVSKIELFITAYLPGASTASSRRRSHAFNSPSSRGRAKAPDLKTPKRRRPRTASSGRARGC